MRPVHRHAGVRQAAEPRYPVLVGSPIAFAGLGCLQLTECVGKRIGQGCSELRGLANPRPQRKRACECQVKVARQRAGAPARMRYLGQYLKQDASEPSVSDPPQGEPQDSGERERRVEGADTGEAEEA